MVTKPSDKGIIVVFQPASTLEPCASLCRVQSSFRCLNDTEGLLVRIRELLHCAVPGWDLPEVGENTLTTH